MSFDFRERSNFDGEPISLYEFALGATTWRYNSSDMDITIGEGDAQKIYEAVAISDDGVTQSGTTALDDVKIHLQSNLAFLNLFVGTPPSEEIYATIRRKHMSDDDAPIVWMGTVSSVRSSSAAASEIVCQTMTATFKRAGLRLSWGRNCPHALYDLGCKVNKAAFADEVVVESVEGQKVFSGTFAAKPINWYSGGFLEWTLEGVTERRAIESHAGARLLLLGTADGIDIGMTITAYPGCTRTVNVCDDKFNNLVNYGGIPHLPGKSPFDGSPVF